MIKYKTYAFFLILSFANFCFSHESLEELIDKCDFVKFKQTYENSNISEEQKAELLNRVSQFIDITSKKLRPHFIGGLPKLNAGKYLKLQPKVSLILGGLTFGFWNLASTVLVFLIYCKHKSILNRYNVTAANFPYSYYANYAQYINERDVRVNDNKKLYWISVLFSFLGSLWGSGLIYLSKTEKRTLLIYKQWKKALKIKALMQGSTKEFEFVKYGIEVLR